MSSPVPNAPTAPVGIQLSALANYAGLPGAIPGVGFWPRALARFIDTLVHYAASFCAGLLFTVLLLIAGGGRVSPLLLWKLKHLTLASIVLSLLGAVAYHTICEGLCGSTLGKLMLSMVVVQEDGSPCRFTPALIRSFAYFIDSLFFGVVGYFAMERTPQEQRYGDEWAHTIVCKRSDAPAASVSSAGRFVAALFLALLVNVALAMIGLLTKITG